MEHSWVGAKTRAADQVGRNVNDGGSGAKLNVNTVERGKSSGNVDEETEEKGQRRQVRRLERR